MIKIMLSAADVLKSIRSFDGTHNLERNHEGRLKGTPTLLNMYTPVRGVPSSDMFCSSHEFLNKDFDAQEEHFQVTETSCKNATARTLKRKLQGVVSDAEDEREFKAAKITRPKKQVRFRVCPNIQTIPRGIDNTWLTRRELSRIKRKARLSCVTINIDDVLHTAYEACRSSAAASSAKNNGSCASSCCCKLLSESSAFRRQRGLEQLSSLAHYRARMVQRMTCKTDFFIEQSVQLLQGRRDEHKLANIYMNTSRAAAQFALFLGQADAVAAVP